MITQKTYEIIKDLPELVSFIDDFLPELEDNEKFLWFLARRNKYSDTEESGRSTIQLTRFLSHKSDALSKIARLACTYGAYDQHKNDGRVILTEQKHLALYVYPNPKDMRIATFNLIKNLVDVVANPNDTTLNYQCHQHALTAIQKSKTKKYWMAFDIDDPNADISFMERYSKEAYKILSTNSGYHLMVRPPFMNGKYWYQDIMNHFDVDNKGTNLAMPVPGCVQGDYVPYILPNGVFQKEARA